MTRQLPLKLALIALVLCTAVAAVAVETREFVPVQAGYVTGGSVSSATNQDARAASPEVSQEGLLPPATKWTVPDRFHGNRVGSDPGATL